MQFALHSPYLHESSTQTAGSELLLLQYCWLVFTGVMGTNVCELLQGMLSDLPGDSAKGRRFSHRQLHIKARIAGLRLQRPAWQWACQLVERNIQSLPMQAIIVDNSPHARLKSAQSFQRLRLQTTLMSGTLSQRSASADTTNNLSKESHNAWAQPCIYCTGPAHLLIAHVNANAIALCSKICRSPERTPCHR